MKKKIDVMQALLLFVSIHIMIAWVAADKIAEKSEKQSVTLPSTSTSTANNTKNNYRQTLSTMDIKTFLMPVLSIWGGIKSNSSYP